MADGLTILTVSSDPRAAGWGLSTGELAFGAGRLLCELHEAYSPHIVRDCAHDRQDAAVACPSNVSHVTASARSLQRVSGYDSPDLAIQTVNVLITHRASVPASSLPR